MVNDENRSGSDEKIEDIAISLTNRVAKGGGVALAGNIVGRTLSFLLNIILGQTLGPEVYGLYSLGVNLFRISGTVSSLGLGQGLVRFSAIFKAQKDEERVKGTILSVIFISFFFSLLLAIALAFYSTSIANFFNEPDLSHILRGFALALPFYVFVGISASLAQSFQRIDYQQGLQSVFRPFMNLVLIGSVLLAGCNIIGVVYSFAVSSLISALLGIYFVWKLYPDILADTKPIFELRRLLRFSIPVFLSGFLFLLLNNIDSLMLGFFNSAEEVGIYNVAARVAQLLSIVLMAFTVISTPIMAELYALQKFDDLTNLYRSITRWILVFSLPIFFLLIFMAPEIMRVFGTGFVVGASTLVILSVGQLFNAGTGPIGKLFETYGKQDLNLWALIGVIGMNISLNIFLIPYYGALGAALATIVSIISVFSVLVIMSNQVIGFHVYNRSYLHFILIIIVVLVSGFIAKEIIGNNQWYSSVVAVLVALIVYIILVMVIGLTSEDWEFINMVKKKLFDINTEKE